MNKPVKFAVIGYGHIGKRHAEMILRNPGAELVAVVDVKGREEVGFLDKNIPFYNSLAGFLQAGIEVDVINIATPNSYHTDQALECLDSKKHVVIEKPISLTKKDAEKVIFKALDVHKHVFVVMQNRFSPSSIWMKKLVDSGKLGRIFMVQLNCYWNRDDNYYLPGSWHGKKDIDGGVLFTQFSHFVDIMYWLFGDIHNIKSKIVCYNHKHSTEFEDSGIVSFDFLNGAIGSLNFSTCAWDKNFESSLTVIAENGSVRIGGQYMNRIEYCHIKDYNLPELESTNPGNEYGKYKGSAQNHNYVIDNIIQVIKGNGSISTNAFEGMKVVEIIERIYAANN